MNISPVEYHFYEWLIVGKNMDKESFDKLSETELRDLRCEFLTWWRKQ